MATSNKLDQEILKTIQSFKFESMVLSKIEIEEWDGIDHKDAPDYCDAFIVSANYDGYPLTEEQIEEIEDRAPDFVYDELMKYL
jgi:hypothetical protein